MGENEEYLTERDPFSFVSDVCANSVLPRDGVNPTFGRMLFLFANRNEGGCIMKSPQPDGLSGP